MPHLTVGRDRRLHCRPWAGGLKESAAQWCLDFPQGDSVIDASWKGARINLGFTEQ
jgi:hypothetical protein